MRLIDADALMEEVNIEIKEYVLTERGVRSLIRNAPTIEPKHGEWIVSYTGGIKQEDELLKALELYRSLVRCGECKYWRAYETWSECVLWAGDPYESAKTNADDYCSYGERKESE